MESVFTSRAGRVQLALLDPERCNPIREREGGGERERDRGERERERERERDRGGGQRERERERERETEEGQRERESERERHGGRGGGGGQRERGYLQITTPDLTDLLQDYTAHQYNTIEYIYRYISKCASVSQQ